MAHLAQKASFAAAFVLFFAASLTAAETTNAPPVGDGWYRGCVSTKLSHASYTERALESSVLLLTQRHCPGLALRKTWFATSEL